LGRPEPDDLDFVVLGDAPSLAHLLARQGLSDHAPVIYPRFGTARVQIDSVGIELATARSESYDERSRKPKVRAASLMEDVLRRDFTVNTLLEGLHDGVLLDLTGWAMPDLDGRIIRTPLEPTRTFKDDPLRMLRAIRLAVTLGFAIENATWEGICREAHRIDLVGSGVRVVSAERIRDEFIKTLMAPDAPRGMELLDESGLLARFLPELSAMRGVSQNAWHSLDVWNHTMKALSEVSSNGSLALRLAVLFHDVGKPVTRMEDERGVHFYRHETVGADMTREALCRLRMPLSVVREVVDLVALHMRLGQVRPDWSDAAVRRLIRETGDRLEALYQLTEADMSAMSADAKPTDIREVRRRIETLNRQMDVNAVKSPLDGREIMELLGLQRGPLVGQAKAYLVNCILDGSLKPDDKEAARHMLEEWAQRQPRCT
jgi:poly(A) polymerase